MNRSILVLILILGTLSISARSPQELWQEANEAYSRGEFNYSIELYEEILDKELVAAELYYNLGNAYFRANQLGKAILNYERALRINPSGENILHNLQFAASRTIDRVEPRTLLFYEKWWRQLYMLQSADAWAKWSIAGITLFLITLSVYLFSRTIGIKKTAFYTALLLFFITIFSFVFAQKQFNRLTNKQEAIILAPRVTAKSSPTAQSPDLFLVHEGTKINIQTTLGGWHEIRLPNGSVGWIREETAEII